MQLGEYPRINACSNANLIHILYFALHHFSPKRCTLNLDTNGTGELNVTSLSETWRHGSARTSSLQNLRLFAFRQAFSPTQGTFGFYNGDPPTV